MDFLISATTNIWQNTPRKIFNRTLPKRRKTMTKNNQVQDDNAKLREDFKRFINSKKFTGFVVQNAPDIYVSTIIFEALDKALKEI